MSRESKNNNVYRGLGKDKLCNINVIITTGSAVVSILYVLVPKEELNKYNLKLMGRIKSMTIEPSRIEGSN
jgi:hypothetical protein